jgi:hypothetical protein
LDCAVQQGGPTEHLQALVATTHAASLAACQQHTDNVMMGFHCARLQAGLQTRRVSRGSEELGPTSDSRNFVESAKKTTCLPLERVIYCHT